LRQKSGNQQCVGVVEIRRQGGPTTTNSLETLGLVAGVHPAQWLKSGSYSEHVASRSVDEFEADTNSVFGICPQCFRIHWNGELADVVRRVGHSSECLEIPALAATGIFETSRSRNWLPAASTPALWHFRQVRSPTLIQALWKLDAAKHAGVGWGSAATTDAAT
jgi:hypothetical protein